jgi:hypothetical protein
MLKRGGKLSKDDFRVTLPSKVLEIRNINTFESSKDFHDFKDLYSDVYDLCSEIGGPVVQIKIPRPIFVDTRIEENRAID